MNLMQRLVVSNLFGLGFVAVSWVAVILIYEASENRAGVFPWLLGSLLLILMDVVYRYQGIRSQHGSREARSDSFKNPWFAPSRGASLIVFVTWIVGSVLAFVFVVLIVRDLPWKA
jgi:hypothetical protein